MSLKGKKILVTGADGFIGAWLCNRLVKEKTQIIALTLKGSILHPLLEKIKKKVEIVEGDITDKKSIEAAFTQKIDCCIHLAAIADTKNISDKIYKVNADGTKNVLEMCAKNKIRNFIFSSTIGVYGEVGNGQILDEKSNINPQNDYTKSKVNAERVILDFCKKNGINAIILRKTNIFGPYDFVTSRIIPNTILRFYSGKNPEIRTNVCTIRNLLFVKDVIEAYVKSIEFLEKNEGIKIINIVGEQSFTVKETLETIARKMNKSFSIKEKCGKTRTKYSNDSARKILGWKPKYSFEDALKETITHYSENQELYQSQIKK